MFAFILQRCGNLLQRCRKSNAEYQAGLNIMLRCGNLLQKCHKSNTEYQACLYIMLRCGNLLQRCRKSNAAYHAGLQTMPRRSNLLQSCRISQEKSHASFTGIRSFIKLTCILCWDAAIFCKDKHFIRIQDVISPKLLLFSTNKFGNCSFFAKFAQ